MKQRGVGLLIPFAITLLPGCARPSPPPPARPGVVVPPGLRAPIKRSRVVSLDVLKGARPQDHEATRIKLTPILAGLAWSPVSKPPALGLSPTGSIDLTELEPFHNRAIAYDQDRHLMTAAIPSEGLFKLLSELAEPRVSHLLSRTTALSVLVLRETPTELLTAEVFVTTEGLPRFKALMTDAAAPHPGFSTVLQWLLNF